jgi:hypothetical protein
VKGIFFPVFLGFICGQKEKTVNARLQCLKGALLYTNGDKKH